MNTNAAGAAAHGAKRRRLTLLFTDLAGSTRLGRAIEPEDYAAVMEAVRGIWRTAAGKHGGRVVRTQGDGALILFGLPEVGEEDGRHAAEAALEIHEAVGQLHFEGLPGEFNPLRMHSGIHAGTLLVAEGDIERGRMDVTGDVANTAAHLCDAAEAGEIVASLDALGPHANLFETVEPQGAVAGLPAREVRLVLGRTGLRRRFDATARRGLTPFIGREEVVAAVDDFLRGNAAAPSRCLVAVGEAGIGKTRLLEELVRGHGIANAMLLQGGCERDAGAEILQPFAQMARAYFGVAQRIRGADIDERLQGELRAWQSELGDAYPALLSLIASDETAVRQEATAAQVAARRSTTGGIVGDLLRFWKALAARSPVLMLVDDWQWADAASLQLLDALLQAETGPQVIVATRPREDDQLAVQGARHVHLAPLSEEQTRQAIRRWLPYADPFLCAQIHEYSGGIPLYIEELCHSASVGGLARAIAGRGAARNWIGSLAVGRLDRLPPELGDLVRGAAVIGNEVPLALLAGSTGRQPSPAALAALSDADFLYPTDSPAVVRFKHGITRDAIYQAIGLRERTALHERVLAVLQAGGSAQRDDDVEALAHHSRGAGRWEEAGRFAERSGDKAMNAFALDRARLHYELAMDAFDRIPKRSPEQTLQWCLLCNKFGMTCVFDPLALGEDTSVFERAVQLAGELGDINALARARYWLAYICYGMGRFRDSLRHARDALDLARQGQDRRLEAQIKATLGQVLAATGDYAEAIERIDEAVGAKRQGRKADDTRPGKPHASVAIGSAYALAVRGGLLADRGEFAGAHACYDEAIHLLNGSTHPVGNSVRNWIAVAHNWQGQWPEARRVAADSLRIAENTRALLLLSAARSSLGYAAWAEEGSAAGLAQLAEAMRWMDERHGRFYTSIYYGWLVAAAVAEGRDEEARGHALKVLQRARNGERLGEAVAYRGLAWLAAKQGDSKGAGRWMRRAEVAAQRRQSPREVAHNLAARGQLLLHAGHTQDARPHLEGAVAAYEGLQMRWHREACLAMREAGAVARPVLS